MKKSPREIDRNNREAIRGLEPEAVFRFFADLSAIPHKSGDMGRIGEYLAGFAKARGLEYRRDAVGNVIIRKPARRSAATAAGDGVILQAHLDMVCVKDAGSPHDFATDPIEFVRDGEWLRANATTLGADNGVGVAIALAVLDSGDLAHPPVEALLTVDEETNMSGVNAVDVADLRGNRLVNIDTEDLGVAYVSSAGAANFNLTLPLRAVAPRPGAAYYSLSVEGLKGGHSGSQINEGLGNAFVLLARVLADAAKSGIDHALCAMDLGGATGADNAIPGKAAALLELPSAAAGDLEKLAAKWTGILGNEFRASDPGVRVALRRAAPADADHPPLAGESRDQLLRVIRLAPLGVDRFVQDANLLARPYGDLLVETSCNLGLLDVARGEAVLRFMSRGSVESALDDIGSRLAALAELAGGKLQYCFGTVAWEMEPEPTPIQRLFADKYGLKLVGVHAGLECGTLAAKFKRAGRSLDVVSVGPDMRGAHSTTERLRIASVPAFWEQLTGVLRALAEAGAIN